MGLKVRKVWECECGKSIVYDPVPDEYFEYIYRGPCFVMGSPRQYIRCKECQDRLLILPRLISWQTKQYEMSRRGKKQDIALKKRGWVRQ